jgi:enterochelin esterase family protein
MAPQTTLRMKDPEGSLKAVRLLGELWKRQAPPAFTRRSPGQPWVLRLDLPPVDRFEYQLQVVGADDVVGLMLDPDAPTAYGPFGGKSVLELPRYQRPAWLDTEAPPGIVEPVSLPSARLRGVVQAVLWRPDGTQPDEPLPLLVAHDGPEYAEHSGLLQYLAVAVAAGEVPPLRAALHAPLRRDDHYGAAQRYSTALVDELIPAVEHVGTPAAMGASLGALALLHAHRQRPDAFAGLFLQSGSFFQPTTDAWEDGHSRFGQITRFVHRVLAARKRVQPVPVTMTCGTAEENLANNVAMRNALVRQGYDAELVLVRDAHNWVAWRDGFHPHLGRLLARVLS